ncbi:MAG: hypothetical protein ACSHXM_15390 [Paraglaciecola sp.]
MYIYQVYVTVMTDVIPTYSHGDILMIDRQTANGLKHIAIVINRPI